MRLHIADYLIIVVYFLFVIGVGFIIKKKIKTSNDFLTSGRNIPLWITSLAFISANLGAQEVLGMVASGAKYGIMTVHFYWVGAIFAMVFLGVFMMPFYYGSRARSVPEFLKLRFDEKTRGLNAISFAVMTILSKASDNNPPIRSINEMMIKKVPITNPRLFNFLYIDFGLKENDIKNNCNCE